MKILVREAKPSDHNFIFATYLRNRYFDKNNKTTLKRSTWSNLHHKRLEDILASKEVKVACTDEDPDLILGYKLPDGSEDYIYVKLGYRQFGVSDILREA